MRNWYVSDYPTLSDHRYIPFQIGNVGINEVTFRDPIKEVRNARSSSGRSTARG